MHRKYFFIILALTAFSLFLMLIFFKQTTPKVPEQPVVVPATPFDTHISGVGVVEPKSGNITIGIPFNRIVKTINVSVNDPVKKDDVILELDHQDLSANLLIKQKEVKSAIANLQKLQAMPRKEDLQIAEEALKKAEIALNESKTQYEMIVNLPNPSAISKQEQDRRLYKYRQAEADFRDMQANYEKIKSGPWKPDLKIALSKVEQSQADLEAIQAEIERTYIKAPIDGTVLQIKLRPGETPGSQTIIIGNTKELNLRVSVDQFNISNISKNAHAIAYRQGNQTTEYPLEFIHIEPFMVPKKYLTNAIDEQVDTQVFEILYRINKQDSDLLIGEQMDVFIDKKN